MAQRKRITWFMQTVGGDPLARIFVLALLLVGVFWTGWQVFVGDWLEAALAALGVGFLVALAASERVQIARSGAAVQPPPRAVRRHGVGVRRGMADFAAAGRCARRSPGKSSEQTYFALVLLVAVSWMLLRSLLILLPPFYRRFATHLPMWEQILLAINEVVAAGLLATYVAQVLVHTLQPQVFTTRFDLPYIGGLLLVFGIYYFGMQAMWTKRWNDWFSRTDIWIRFMRLAAPLALVVTTMVIFRHFIDRADPRSANLLGNADLDLAFLALAPVIWLLVFVVVFIVYTSGRGLRQRFLPDLLLDRLPRRVGHFLRSISDMDLLLILGVLGTMIPGYLLLFGDTGGVIGGLRQQILQRGSALIESSEQALALLFAIPFYLLVVALLALYGYTLSQQTLAARDRDELVASLPIGFLIVLIITLYLFSIPFSQVLTEGRLPQLPQDMGRILAFNIVIPLLLLYAHYFALIRMPYSRGQKRWRERQSRHYAEQLSGIDHRIRDLNGEIAQLDSQWHSEPGDSRRFETLYRYVQLNGLRDDLNMQRLQVVSDRQQLAELSEAPVSIAIARLPVRVVSIGIPLLLAVQIYQWAVLNNGLREIVNNPNITIFEFFRAILRQTQF
ncbi:MAG: hypothetical protein U0521_15865 [Anaerolineae bacterium]